MSVFDEAEYLMSAGIGAIYSSVQFPTLIPCLKSHRILNFSSTVQHRIRFSIGGA
jgi:hypothetical protein